MRQSWSVNNLTNFVVDSVQNAHADDAPFHHLRFDRVFPDDFYAAMLQAMPVADDYRAMSGKSKVGSSRPDGKPTRAKIDLFPEYIRHFTPEKRAVWDAAGRVLRSKEFTVQFYLTPDNSTPHVGTIFHEVLPNGRKPKKAQMPFSPNTGYAFAVADNTWHSADPVGPEVNTRDSILLTYFVDAGAWRFLRNRGRRAANFVLNELRNLKRS